MTFDVGEASFRVMDCLHDTVRSTTVMTSSRRLVAHEHRGGKPRRLFRAEARARHGRRSAPNTRGVTLVLGLVPHAAVRRGRFHLGGPDSHVRALQNARPTRGLDRVGRGHERRHCEEHDEERARSNPRRESLPARGTHDDGSRASLEVFQFTRRKRNLISSSVKGTASPSSHAVNTACCARSGRCAESPRPPDLCADRIPAHGRWRAPRAPRLWTAACGSAPSTSLPRKYSPRPP